MPSTVIRRFNYDPDERQLHVTFVSGRRYRYDDVPPDVVQEMRQAVSKGQFFNHRIRDVFPTSRES
jgi:hypothetical protein